MSQTGINVFRDLTIESKQIPCNAIRQLLLAHKAKDWVHAKDQEDQLRQYAVGAGSEDVVVFAYEGTNFPKAALTLWQRQNGYKVTNIVPAEMGRLDTTQYNDLLCDFVQQVVGKIKANDAFEIRLSDDVQQLDHWIPGDAAEALRKFSVLANKSTTNSHPSDAGRWEEFVIRVHRSGKQLPVDVLMQWLADVDGWDETSASKLAIDYEKGISLLEAYDAFLRG